MAVRGTEGLALLVGIERTITQVHQDLRLGEVVIRTMVLRAVGLNSRCSAPHLRLAFSRDTQTARLGR